MRANDRAAIPASIALLVLSLGSSGACGSAPTAPSAPRRPPARDAVPPTVVEQPGAEIENLFPAQPLERDPGVLPDLIVRLSPSPLLSWFDPAQRRKIIGEIGQPKIFLKSDKDGATGREIVLPRLDSEEWKPDEFVWARIDIGDAFSEEGTFRISFEEAKGATRIEQRIEVLRGDVAIQVDVFFSDGDFEGHSFPFRVASCTTTRVRPSPGKVLLLRDWAPSGSGEPAYVIRNQSERTIFCSDLLAPFAGQIYSLEGNRWKFFTRGIPHDSRGPETEIAPGKEGRSEEMIYETRKAPIPPGRHMYSVRYMTRDWTDWASARDEEAVVDVEYFEYSS